MTSASLPGHSSTKLIVLSLARTTGEDNAPGSRSHSATGRRHRWPRLRPDGSAAHAKLIGAARIRAGPRAGAAARRGAARADHGAPRALGRIVAQAPLTRAIARRAGYESAGCPTALVRAITRIEIGTCGQGRFASIARGFHCVRLRIRAREPGPATSRANEETKPRNDDTHEDYGNAIRRPSITTKLASPLAQWTAVRAQLVAARLRQPARSKTRVRARRPGHPSLTRKRNAPRRNDARSRWRDVDGRFTQRPRFRAAVRGLEW